MSPTARAAVIAGHCKALRTPAISREYPSLSRQATQEG